MVACSPPQGMTSAQVLHAHGWRAGVMCLDFHPSHAHLLAAGLHDGSVLVLSVHSSATRPALSTSVETGKHADIGVKPLDWLPCSDMKLRIMVHTNTSATCPARKHDLHARLALTERLSGCQDGVTIHTALHAPC